MPKIGILKLDDDYMYPRAIFKSQRNIYLKMGEIYPDKDIARASLIIVYFTVSTDQYMHHMIIPKYHNQWYMDTTNNWITYIWIDWEVGRLITSQYGTVNDNHFVMGYDLVA